MKFKFENIIDAYKLDHRRQYPEGITEVLSNFTPRGSRVKGVDHVVFFGLQVLLDDLQEYFDDFIARDVDDICEEYEQNHTEILGPNDIGSDHIRALHDLGYLPLEFQALPEGSLVPLKVPMFTVRNTHPDFFWLVNYLETWISSEIWLPCTSATTAKLYRDILESWAKETGAPLEAVDFQAHDFSFRGMDSVEAAAKSGAGHLLFFRGSDTLPAKDFLKAHYSPVEPVLLSVAATEHSVMCAGGNETELQTYSRLLDLYPSGIVSVVSDTWDLWEVITGHLPALKDKIEARDGKLVIRPDSGDPADILCGTAPARTGFRTNTLTGEVVEDWRTPEEKGVVELLWEIFGGTRNDKGFKVLSEHIGAIYGDSITLDRARDICKRLAAKGFASHNVVLGVGSFTYTGMIVNNGEAVAVTRDTYGFAMKATNIVKNGEDVAIFKDPKTDGGEKKSAKGRLAVIRPSTTEDFVLLDQLDIEDLAVIDESGQNWLFPVWTDGEFNYRTDLDEVKENLGL